jgi:hypothetical protein
LADQAARAFSTTIDSTTSRQRQPPSQLPPNGTGVTPLNPNVANTCSGGGSIVTQSD